MSKNSVVDFSFYCFTSQRRLVPGAIGSIIDQGLLGHWFLEDTEPRILENPGKMAVSRTTSERRIN